MSFKNDFRRFMLISGDTWIGGTNLEGGMFSENIPYVTNFMERYIKEKTLT